MNTGSYLMCGLLISQIVLPVGAEQSKTYNTGLVRTRLEGKRGPAELWECHFSDSVKVKRVENPAWYKDFAHEIEKNCSSSLQNGAKYLLTFKDGKVGKLTTIATSGSAELDAIGEQAIRKSVPYKKLPISNESYRHGISIRILGKDVTVERFPLDGR